MTPERVLKMRAAWAASDAKRDEHFTEPDCVNIVRNITYGFCEPSKEVEPGEKPYRSYGADNLLDVYTPKSMQGELLPTIVSIHGGGYFYGDKELYRFYCMHLAESGFAVVNMNYRLAPEYKYPSSMQDIHSVMKWIERYGSFYGIDRDKVFLIGDSAGAQLACEYAIANSNAAYSEAIGLSDKPNVTILGVSLACGMYYVGEREKLGETADMVTDYLGADNPLKETLYSALDYITDAFPPAMVFSSKDDFLRESCEPLVALLKEKGVPAKGHIYGLDEDRMIYHVFHLDLNEPVGQKANRDQIEFFMGILEGI
ncbi:MAG: alpha/beta hydrolase [Lachnospiraceae bacterium]|nr:alpha/beta hydrolase [Lachnospiraceae bacterium]